MKDSVLFININRICTRKDLNEMGWMDNQLVTLWKVDLKSSKISVSKLSADASKTLCAYCELPSVVLNVLTTPAPRLLQSEA